MEESVYSKDGPFNDPVVRCDSCAKLLNRVTLQDEKTGGRCPFCGSRKVRKMDTFTSEELQKMKEWNIDPNYLKLFEEVSDVA